MFNILLTVVDIFILTWVISEQFSRRNVKPMAFLEKRKQRTRVNGCYSNFDDIFSGVPQGSILGPLLFNTYICDLFYGFGDLDIASYADDNTPYTLSSELDVAQ